MEAAQVEVGGVPASWSIQEVGVWLSALGLPAELQVAFAKNAVDGADLIALSDDDLRSELGCTPLQARKIRQHLSQLGVPVPATSAAASTASLGAAAAALAPAVAAAVDAEPDPKAAFDLADLQRYRQLEAHLGELQGLQPTAKACQAQAHLESVQRALNGAQAAIPPIQQALQVEHKHIAKYSGEKFSLTGAFTTQHHKDVKLAEAQAKAESLSSQLAAAEAAVAARQGEVQEARAQLSAWQAKVSDLSATQGQLREHVERMFAAPAWRASPRLAQLADALKALQGQAAEAARGAQTYGRGTQLLRESDQLLQAALQGLQQTQMFTMMEMGMDMGYGFGRHVPGHLFEDIFEMQIIQRSNDEVAAAAAKTLEARTLLPGLPQVDSRVLESARMGIFQNILFGGVGSDMIEMAMIQRSKRDVEVMAQQVAQARGWAQSNQAVYQNKDAEARAAVAARQAELDAFRSAALRKALA